jgi:hypothetical protein
VWRNQCGETENIVASGEGLHALGEGIVGRRVDKAGADEQGASCRAADDGAAIDVVADLGAVRRHGAHDGHGQEEGVLIEISDGPAIPGDHVLSMDLGAEIQHFRDKPALGLGNGRDAQKHRDRRHRRLNRAHRRCPPAALCAAWCFGVYASGDRN